MRKGTHCCSECRRRKVRCVFEGTRSECNECFSRNIQCVTQDSGRSNSNSLHETEETLQFLQNLEKTIHHVLRSHHTQTNPTTSGEHGQGAAPKPAAPLSFTGVDTDVSIVQESPQVAEDLDALVTFDAFSSRKNEFNQAPLLSLFDDKKLDRQDSRSESIKKPDSRHSLDKNESQMLRDMKLRAPNVRTFSKIFESSQHIWAFWQRMFREELDWGPTCAKEKQVAALQHLFYTTLHSDDTVRVVKVTLCLALQLQQLPPKFSLGTGTGTDYGLALQDFYMTTIGTILHSDEGLVRSLDGLECLLLQCEFYINLGNLRKVWMITRRAVTFAQLLQLHQKVPGQSTDLATRGKGVWQQIWQLDRGFSLILGLPYSVPEYQCSYPAGSAWALGRPNEERFLCRLAVIMGHIIDRNQTDGKMTYSTTLSLDEELDECKRMMPDEWWNSSHDYHSSPDHIFHTYSAKLRFMNIRKLLHLPFLLRSYENNRYSESRQAILDCSREMIAAINSLRDEKNPVLKRCDMADFLAFSAALTLVIDLLARHRPRLPHDLLQDKKDWQLVHSAMHDLRRSSQVASCMVAGQSAKVLEDLCATYQHDFKTVDFHSATTGPASRPFEVDIPFFGKVSIRRLQGRDRQSDQQPGSTSSDLQKDHHHHTPHTTTDSSWDSSAFDPFIDPILSSDSSLYPYTTDLAAQPWQQGGVNEDWTSMFDSSMLENWIWLPNDEEDRTYPC